MKYKHLFVQNTFSSQQFVILASIIKFSKKNYFEFSVIYPKTLDDSHIEYLFNKIKSQNENILPKKKFYAKKNSSSCPFSFEKEFLSFTNTCEKNLNEPQSKTN